MMATMLLLGVLLLAFANGANDNFKGLATLYGSGRLSYRRAIGWATITTLAGSILSVFLAGRLLERFTGKGLVPDAVVAQPEFAAAVALAAALTVLLATQLGLPISTTHGLIGALSGAGFVAAGWHQFHTTHLAALFLLPLLVSPLLAGGSLFLFYPVVHRLRIRLGIEESHCLCLACSPRTALATAPVTHRETLQPVAAPARWQVVVDSPSVCQRHYTHARIRLDLNRILDGAHLLSSGLVSFARGLNDTPKIVALLLALKALNVPVSLVMVALVMALGGLLRARQVARTLAFGITPLNPGQGLLANLSTSATVLVASYLGLPVSTTHVSTGSLFGMGALTGKARGRMIRRIMFAWLVTVPVAAVFGALAIILMQKAAV